MQRAKLVIFAVITIAAIVVVVQNTAPVETRLFFVTIAVSHAVLLLLALAMGFVLGLLFSFRSTRKKEPSS